MTTLTYSHFGTLEAMAEHIKKRDHSTRGLLLEGFQEFRDGTLPAGHFEALIVNLGGILSDQDIDAAKEDYRQANAYQSVTAPPNQQEG
jgi:hypothetical protein